MKLENLPARYREQVSEAMAATEKKKRSKWRNVPTVVDGIRFDSKHEAAVWEKLKAIYGAERVLRQVSFPISLSERMKIDFMVILSTFSPDGYPAQFSAMLIDAKGRATKDWQRKARALERIYGIRVETM